MHRETQRQSSLFHNSKTIQIKTVLQKIENKIMHTAPVIALEDEKGTDKKLITFD